MSDTNPTDSSEQVQDQEPRESGNTKYSPIEDDYDRYIFSPEEERVLEECYWGSIFTKSLPLSIGMAGVAYATVKKGWLQPNRRFGLGPVPKMFIFGLVGWYVGKVLYLPVCAEKFMDLPESQLGAYLRLSTKGRRDDSNDTFPGPPREDTDLDNPTEKSPRNKRKVVSHENNGNDADDPDYRKFLFPFFILPFVFFFKKKPPTH